ncbi:outer membrane beta-barrel protein [Povalibacter sp.]|uniref:outer membrane beta-barrel protein n=1 Tax=Povalibacter sp. TaxID=1962978 RepID=UPI002F3F2C77
MKIGSIGATGLGLLATLFACLPASAAERGFYIGGFYGQTDASLAKAGFDDLALRVYGSGGFTPETSVSTLDNKSSGYGFVGGYRWLRNLALEGGYVDLGKYVYRDQSTGSNFDLNGDQIDGVMLGQKLTVKEAGIMLSALGILPLSYRSELYLRGGLLLSSNKISGSIEDEFGSFSIGSNTDSDTDFLLGVGASFTVAEIYAMRLEYLRVLDMGDKNLWGEADVDMVSLGFTVTF